MSVSSVRSLLVSVFLPVGLAAQGGLAVQGFGYPLGQVSASAAGAGGASAEFDAGSALNPAALATGARYSVYMQLEPEARQTRLGAATASVRVMRFPGFAATGSIGKLVAGLSFTSLLDRTWFNQYEDSAAVNGVTYPSTVVARSDGGIADTRFAVAYALRPRLQVGIALHALTGQNRIAFGRTFPDSTGIGSAEQSTGIAFRGRGVSLGVVVLPVKDLVIGLSARTSGPLTARQDDSLWSARLPDRFGMGVAWIGIPNTTLSARIDRIRWRQLAALGTTQMSTFDATDLGAGLEVIGPRIAGAASTLRGGYRVRGLPFGVGSEAVDERSMTGGMSVPLGRSRGQVDLGVQRISREAAGAVERAWLLSLGFGIRP